MSYIGNTPTTQSFTPAVDYFSGNGSTTAFTLSRPVASVAQVQVAIENVPQNPGDAFTVSGSTITFTSAPPSGTNNIYVYYTSPITQVIAPSDGTVGTSALASSSVTQAKLGTNVAGTGPAFSAYASTTTSCATAVSTKVNLASENFDTANCFASSRFTPNVAGYYQFNFAVRMEGINSYQPFLFINGAAAVAGNNPSIGSYCNTGSALVYMNGTTDYAEMYCYNGNASTQTVSANSTQTVFSGALVRAA